MRTIIGFVLAKTKYKVGLVNYKRDAYIMAIPVVEFLRKGYEIRKVLG